LALVLTTIGLLAYALGSTDAARWLADRAEAATQDRLSVGPLSGNLWRGLDVEIVRWRDPSLDLRLERLSVKPDWSALLLGQWAFSEIVASRLQLVVAASSAGGSADPRAAVPALTLPLPLRIDVLRLARLELSNSAAATGDSTVVEALELSAEYRPGRLRIERLAALGHGLTLSGEALELEDRAPHRLSGRLRLSADSAGFAQWLGLPAPPGAATPPSLQVELSGRLEALSAQLALLAWGASAQVRLEAAPFETPPSLRLEGAFEGLDLRAWSAAWPRAVLGGRFSYAAPAQAFELSVAQATPLPLDRQGLPVAAARVTGTLNGPVVSIDRLSVDLREPSSSAPNAAVTDGSLSRSARGPAGRVTGRLRIDRGAPVVAGTMRWPALEGELTVSQLDARALGSQWPSTRASGRLVLQPRRLQAQLEDSRLSADPLALQAELVLADTRIMIERAQLSLGSARASARGSLGLAEQDPIDLSGRFERVDGAWLAGWLPAGLALPQTLLGGDWRASRRAGGATPAPLAAALTLDRDSRLAGRALTGAVQAEWMPGRVRTLDLQLAQGADRLSVRGAIGATDDRLTIIARIADVARLMPQLAGPARLDAELVGRPESPAFQLDLSAGPLKLTQAAPQLAAERLELRLTAAGVPTEHRFEVTAQMGEERLVSSGRGSLPMASPAAPGSAPARGGSAAGGKVAAKQPGSAPARDPVSLSAASGPSLASPLWRASLEQLRISGTVPASLERPASLKLDEAGAIDVREVELTLAQGRVRIDRLSWQDGVLRSVGDMAALSLAPLADRLEAGPAPAAMRVSGSAVDARRAASPNGPSGQRPGSPDTATREAAARLRALQVSGRWDLQGATWQHASGSVALEVQRAPGADATGPATEAVFGESRLRVSLREGALAGEARLTIPSLAFTRRLTAPDWVAEGALALDGRIGGTIERPELNGQLSGERLSLANRSLGWRLRDGQLAARLDGRVLRIASLRFASGERGIVELTGEIAPLADAVAPNAVASAGTGRAAERAPFDADLGLRLERFIVPLPPGQRLLLSGQTRLVARDGKVSWSGTVTADDGLIEFGSLSAPDLPTDLVIIDRREQPANGTAAVRAAGARTERPAAASAAPERREAASPPSTGSAGAGWMPVVDSNLRVALGERLRVQGGGLDARLTGELTLAGRLPREPRVSGRVQLRDGTFQAYGRKLELTRGEVRFAGEVDNPFIDIIALRRHQEVDAGVAVTGPARAPRIRLVSEPDLPDAQKLSWLVLGTGLEDAAAAGQALALREAALNLLGEDDGGLVGGLSQALGIDSVSFGRSVSAGRDPLSTARLGPPGLSVPGAASGSAAAAGSVRQEVVSVSKRLNSRLTLSYERGLQGLWNLVRLQYEISNRLSLRAQSGSENAVDLLYFWWFD
jgi:translocation and assembly module TamB